METPKPVALSGMEAIIANARKIMAKTDRDKPIVMSETTLKQTAIEEAEEPSVSIPTARQGYTKEQVLNSNFAQPIKDMMIKSINERLEDTSELEDIPMIPNKRQPYLKNPVPLQETRQLVNSDMITMSRADFKALVKENVLEFLIENYNKTLTEQAIKKTINVLIKEGKLTVKNKNV
jgi:hypothetical protein